MSNPPSTPYLDLRGIEYENKQEYHSTAPQTARSIGTVSTVHGTPRSHDFNSFRKDHTDNKIQSEQSPYSESFVRKVFSLDSDSSNVSNNDNNYYDDDKNSRRDDSSVPEKKTKKSPSNNKKKNNTSFDDLNNCLNDTGGGEQNSESLLLLPLSSAMIKNPQKDRKNEDENKRNNNNNNNNSDSNIRPNSSNNQIYGHMKSEEHSIQSPSSNVLKIPKYQDKLSTNDQKLKNRRKDDNKDTNIAFDLEKHCSDSSKSQFLLKDGESEIQYGSIGDFDVDSLLRKNM